MSGATYPRREWAKYVCNYSHIGQCDYKHTHGEKKIERCLLASYENDLRNRYLHLKEIRQVDNSAQISALYRKMDRLKDLYVNDLIDIETYKADLERYRGEIKALGKPAEANTEAIEKLLKLTVLDIYETLSNAQKRRLWCSVIKSITPRDGSFFVEYF